MFLIVALNNNYRKTQFFKYEFESILRMQSKKVVLLGFGPTSRPFAARVQEILRDRYKIDAEMPPEEKKILFQEITGAVRDKNLHLSAFYRDNEASSNMPVEDCQKLFPNSLTYVMQQTRIYDDTLEITVNRMRSILEKAQDSMDPTLLKSLTESFKTLTATFDTGEERKYVALHSVPDHNLRKIIMLANRAKNYGAEGIRVVLPKTSYEWTHNSPKYRAKGIDESNTLEQTLLWFRSSGINGLIAMHLHAPKDVLNHAKRILPERKEEYQNPLEIINVNPQSFAQVNGETVRLEEIFGCLGTDYSYFHPFDRIINESIASKISSYGLDKDSAKLLLGILCPDLGALESTQDVSEHYGIVRLTSEKSRAGEGLTKRKDIDSLEGYLTNLTQKLRDAGRNPTQELFIITLYNIDDKLNSGNTANDEARARKKEVSDFNEKNGTKYQTEYFLCCSHIRTPDLRRLNHEHVDRIIASDSVTYYPDLLIQLKEYEQDNPKLKGISHKMIILPFTAQMIAAGIALDIYHQDSAYQEKIDSLRKQTINSQFSTP